MQVLPVSSVANFQLWAVGARGRAEAARVPLPRGAARRCARASSPALFCGVWEAFYRRQDGGSPYFGAGCPVKQMWPPRPCTASSSKGEGALATSRGEIGGRLGEATLPYGRVAPIGGASVYFTKLHSCRVNDETPMVAQKGSATAPPWLRTSQPPTMDSDHIVLSVLLLI